MGDSMRVCFVALAYPPSIGGSQARAEKQARQLQALGHEVIVVTTRFDRRLPRAEEVQGVPVVRVGGVYTQRGELRMGRLGHIPADIGMFLHLWKLRHSYDVIHVFQLSSLAAVAALIGKLTHTPVVISLACDAPDEAQLARLYACPMLMADTLTNASFLKIDSKHLVLGEVAFLPRSALGGNTVLNFLRKSDAFYQVLSNRGRPYLTSQGFRGDRIVHIPGSVDTEKFQPAPERMPSPTSPERDVLCVARLEYSKGIDVLLHAWARVLQAPMAWRQHLRPRLRLVGDGVLRPQMERIAWELGIHDSVEFLGSRRDVVDLLQASWAFVLPSRWEGMPNALLEAMACGLPCAATRVSGTEDIITDGLNGLLVEPEQPIQMASALSRIIADTDLAERLGREGRATVVATYQLTGIVQQCLGLYRRLLDSSGNNESGASDSSDTQTSPLRHAGALEKEGV